MLVSLEERQNDVSGHVVEDWLELKVVNGLDEALVDRSENAVF